MRTRTIHVTYMTYIIRNRILTGNRMQFTIRKTVESQSKRVLSGFISVTCSQWGEVIVFFFHRFLLGVWHEVRAAVVSRALTNTFGKTRKSVQTQAPFHKLSRSPELPFGFASGYVNTTPRKYVFDVTSIGQMKLHLGCKLHFPSAQFMSRQCM